MSISASHGVLSILSVLNWWVIPAAGSCCQKDQDDHAAVKYCCCSSAGVPVDAQTLCNCGVSYCLNLRVPAVTE
jgi:hypothetical protein